MIIKQDRVAVKYDVMKRLVRCTGLRSKKIRKIKKRFKVALTNAMWNHVIETLDPLDLGDISEYYVKEYV